MGVRVRPDPANAEFQQQVLILVITILVIFISTAVLVAVKFVRQPDAKKFLNRDRQRAVLAERIALSHDTRLFRFVLPPNHVLGLPCGQHIKIFCPNPSIKTKQQWNGKEDTEASEEIERKYTPTSSDRDLERFDLVVKVYKPQLPRFEHGGKASQFLETLQLGDELEFSGPWGTIQYMGNGVFNKNRKPLSKKCTQVAMIAGGTGITPMLQVLEEIMLENADTEVQVSLLFANQTEEDILLRDRLDDLQRHNPSKFKLHFTVDRTTNPQWEGSVGFVTRDMLEKQLPKFGEDTVVLICGPPPMVKMLKEHLTALDCPSDRILEF